MKKYLLCLATALSALTITAQNKTIVERNKDDREAAAKHKVMLVPFEPRLYLGEIDQQLAMEGKLNGKEIRHRFRDGLNQQLFRAFKAVNFNAVDLMSDTSKFKKDTEGIYQYLAYEYMKVPDQNNYKPPVKEKQQKRVEKGQLVVETNTDKRFMNAKVTNAKVVPMMYGKYKTDIFVFINQLDIKASGSPDPGLVMQQNPNRKITVHYTVYSYDAKEINSGIVEEEFEPSLNNQKKIIDKYFAKIANTIAARVVKGLGPVK